MHAQKYCHNGLLAPDFRGDGPDDESYRTSSESSGRLSAISPSDSASQYNIWYHRRPSLGNADSKRNLHPVRQTRRLGQTQNTHSEQIGVTVKERYSPDSHHSSDSASMDDRCAEKAPDTPPSPKQTPDTSPVSAPPDRLRRSTQSLTSYSSRLSSKAKTTQRASISQRKSFRESSVSIGRLTEQPRKREPLFQYIDWNGLPAAAPVKRAPPVSFNRWVRDSSHPVAMTSVIRSEMPKRLNVSGENDSASFGARSRVATREMSVRLPSSVIESERATKPDGYRETLQPQGDGSGGIPIRPIPLSPFKPLDSPRSPTAPPRSFYILPDASVSHHVRNLSDSSDDSVPSVATDKLPNVTHPGKHAYYSRYLAASMVTNPSSTDASSQEYEPSLHGAEILARHKDTPLAVFPPSINKPLPPIPSERARGSSAQDHGLASLTELEQKGLEFEKLRTATMELQGMLLDAMSDISACASTKPHVPPQTDRVLSPSVQNVRSRFSEYEDDHVDTDCKIKEIDPKAFGRAKCMHMRLGCKGWVEYREQMLEESKGKQINHKKKKSKESWLGRHVRKLSGTHV